MGACYVCGGRLKPTELGHKRYRHDRCAPGTVKWCEWYEGRAASERTEAGDLLYKRALERRAKNEQRADGTARPTE